LQSFHQMKTFILKTSVHVEYIINSKATVNSIILTANNFVKKTIFKCFYSYSMKWNFFNYIVILKVILLNNFGCKFEYLDIPESILLSWGSYTRLEKNKAQSYLLLHYSKIIVNINNANNIVSTHNGKYQFL